MSFIEMAILKCFETIRDVNGIQKKIGLSWNCMRDISETLLFMFCLNVDKKKWKKIKNKKFILISLLLFIEKQEKNLIILFNFYTLDFLPMRKKKTLFLKLIMTFFFLLFSLFIYKWEKILKLTHFLFTHLFSFHFLFKQTMD